jgi:hypothetical protein
MWKTNEAASFVSTSKATKLELADSHIKQPKRRKQFPNKKWWRCEFQFQMFNFVSGDSRSRWPKPQEVALRKSAVAAEKTSQVGARPSDTEPGRWNAVEHGSCIPNLLLLFRQLLPSRNLHPPACQLWRAPQWKRWWHWDTWQVGACLLTWLCIKAVAFFWCSHWASIN